MKLLDIQCKNAKFDPSEAPLAKFSYTNQQLKPSTKPPLGSISTPSRYTMTSRTSLQRRKSGTYYFRKKVPVALRHLVGKTEIVKSLGTCDYQEALYLTNATESSTMLHLNQLAISGKSSLDLSLSINKQENIMSQNALASLCGAGNRHVEAKSFPISQALKLWEEESSASKKSVADWKTAIRQFIELYGDIETSQITKKHIKDFLNVLPPYKGTKAASTPRRKLITVFFNFHFAHHQLKCGLQRHLNRHIDCF